MNIPNIWFPILQNWLADNFTENQSLYLVIDRTKWERKNLLMISLVYDHRAIPIYFEALEKLGNRDFSVQSQLFSQVLPLFKNYRMVVLGDREFCSVKLTNWLREQGFQFCLRLKKNEFIQAEDGIWQELKSLGLKPGISRLLPNCQVTKTHKVSGFNIAGKWKRNLKGESAEEGWFILTSLPDLSTAIKAYKKRFDIEEMFRDFKSGGYQLEEKNVAGGRLISLILIICLAYSWTTFKGEAIKRSGRQKYIGRVKEVGRVTRRYSSFYIGLYSYNWVSFREHCWEIVQELTQLNRNKLEYYLRGLRAMELILFTF